eukprot:scaffold9331_cov116-Isochrysis_galbana.AAC.10
MPPQLPVQQRLAEKFDLAVGVIRVAEGLHHVAQHLGAWVIGWALVHEEARTVGWLDGVAAAERPHGGPARRRPQMSS